MSNIENNPSGWDLSTLKPNPKNPRRIDVGALERLKESIESFPKMMSLRPIIIDNDRMIIGGNRRYEACILLGYKTVPEDWVRLADNLTKKEIKKFVIVDNAPEGLSGQWDWDILGQEWDEGELLEFGFDHIVGKTKEPEIEPERGEVEESGSVFINLLFDGNQAKIFREAEVKLRGVYDTDNTTDTVFKCIVDLANKAE